MYLVIFFRLPGTESAVSPTSLSTSVLCKIDRSGFRPVSAADSDGTAGGDEVVMTTGLAAAAACDDGLD